MPPVRQPNSIPKINSDKQIKTNTNSLKELTLQNVQQPTVNDETEESSSNEKFDSGSENEDLFCRSIGHKWERIRADLAWRWSWLQSQINELKYQINLCDQEYQKLRQNKELLAPLKPIPEVSEDSNIEIDYCLRTVGFSKPTVNRKLLRRAPTNLSARNAVSEGSESHPLFSWKERKRRAGATVDTRPPKKVITRKPEKERVVVDDFDEDFLDDEMDIVPPKLNERRGRNLSVSIPDLTSSPKPASVRRTASSSSLVTDGNSSASIMRSPSTPLLNRPQTRKQSLRTRDFNINAIVLPSPQKIEVKAVKEIITPVWKAMMETEVQSKLEEEQTQQQQQEEHQQQEQEQEQQQQQQPQAQEAEEKKDIVKKEETSSEEDTGDERYVVLHFARELEERKKYFTERRLPEVLGEELVKNFPTEFFVIGDDFPLTPKTASPRTPLVRPTPDLAEKLKSKFKNIRERYYHSPKFERNWETIGEQPTSVIVYSSDSDTNSDELFEKSFGCGQRTGNRRSKRRRNNTPPPPIEKWEVVKQTTPLIDPVTNQVRNIIRLRKITSVTSPKCAPESNPSTPCIDAHTQFSLNLGASMEMPSPSLSTPPDSVGSSVESMFAPTDLTKDISNGSEPETSIAQPSQQEDKKYDDRKEEEKHYDRETLSSEKSEPMDTTTTVTTENIPTPTSTTTTTIIDQPMEDAKCNIQMETQV